MAKKQFKTESKRLLDLMINSIYTNKEIFLRELISNASDALDKRHYMALTDSAYACSDPLKINLAINKDAKELVIEDNGVGMNSEDLENNLGVIAHSGSLDFKKQLDEKSETDIIGQFGVGFYSAFMVADLITVESKKVGCDAAKWVSNGQDGYTVSESEKETIGTKITLKIREDNEDVHYSDYLDSYHLQQLVKKYSDYIRYPIQMMIEKEVPVEGKEGEYKTEEELKTLNTMTPLWKKDKKDITAEEYNNFYKSQYFDYEDPAEVIHYTTEGNLSYKALLYIPSRVPFDYYSKDYEAGLQLYSKGVFIVDHAKDLLPDYFHFVKGLVDSEDISLNISREMLQQDKQLQDLNKSLSKKIKSTLVNMLTKEREKYENFFKNFGRSLKYGCYQDYGMHKDDLQDLLLFYSSFEDKYVTLKEYKERMKEGQNSIYFASGKTIESIKKLPQIETLLDKGYEVLYLTEDIDEFVLMMMHDYDTKEFKSAQKASTEVESEEEKKETENLQKSNEDLLKCIKEELGEKVFDVRISSRLKTHPVCLVADEGISMEMEKTLSQMPDQDAKAKKILEINPEHKMFEVLKSAYADNKEMLKDYAYVLYNQALMIEGFPVEDAVEYSNRVCHLLEK